MDKIILRGYAKLNLSLDITGLRPDGYHLMDMVMQSVSLFDRVTITRAETLDPAAFPYGPSDTAYRAARAFLDAAGLDAGAAITVEKHIPAEAGMAGGSADAAAVLRGMDILFGTNLGDKLLKLAEQVGADVPFCLTGGTARVQGIGEKLVPLPFFGSGCYLVVKPPFGIPTPAAFKAYDQISAFRRPDTPGILKAMETGDIPALETLSENVLEQAVGRPEIAAIRRALKEAGAPFTRMTGAGSAVFGLFESEELAAAARPALSDYGTVFLCRPVETGVEVESCL